MSQFCKNNGTTQLYGAPRKPSTQDLVDSNNQTVKQNIRKILKEKKQSPNHLGEAAYKRTLLNMNQQSKLPLNWYWHTTMERNKKYPR